MVRQGQEALPVRTAVHQDQEVPQARTAPLPQVATPHPWVADTRRLKARLAPDRAAPCPQVASRHPARTRPRLEATGSSVQLLQAAVPRALAPPGSRRKLGVSTGTFRSLSAFHVLGLGPPGCAASSPLVSLLVSPHWAIGTVLL